MTDTALSLLQDGEICVIVLRGIEAEVVWSAERGKFLTPSGEIEPDDVDEWRPASVKF